MRYLAILWLLAAPLACGDDNDHDHDHDAPDAATSPSADAAPVDATAGRVETSSFEFVRGKLIEAVLEVPAGDRVQVQLTSSPNAVVYNIHAHAGGETTYYVEDESTTADFEFTSPATQTYWLLFGNASSDDVITVDVRLELFGDAQLTSWGD